MGVPPRWSLESGRNTQPHSLIRHTINRVVDGYGVSSRVKDLAGPPRCLPLRPGASLISKVAAVGAEEEQRACPKRSSEPRPGLCPRPAPRSAPRRRRCGASRTTPKLGRPTSSKGPLRPQRTHERQPDTVYAPSAAPLAHSVAVARSRSRAIRIEFRPIARELCA